jgi:hypothetical protein
MREPERTDHDSNHRQNEMAPTPGNTARQPTFEGTAHAPDKPKPESVTPPSAGGERKPLPPFVAQPQSLTAPSSAELSRNPPSFRAPFRMRTTRS